MTALSTRERHVLALVNRHGTLAVRADDRTAGTVRALARRGLVTFDSTAGVVRRKEG